jgi:microcystin degradation protein MlrC
MRIAIVGISIEIMLSNPVKTEEEALQHCSPEEMREGDVWIVRGMMARLREEPDIELVPLGWVTALPGGPVASKAYQGIKTRTLRLIEEQGPFDCILVANHGALEIEGLDRDGDTDFIESIRRQIGADVPIGVALDLHGDMTADLLRAVTVFSVLRTAPHRDDKETGYRAADQVLRVIKNRLTPKRVAVRIPILIPGEIAVTALKPAKELYGSLPAYSAKLGMLEANILVGFAWNDRPWTSATALVVSETDADLAKATALDLAGRIWDQRQEFQLRMETAETAEGLLRAAHCSERPIYVSDSGDNTTAEAPGDLTLVLQAALDLPEIDDIVIPGITAPKTLQSLLAAGIGNSVEIELGSEHLSHAQTRRKVTAQVEAGGSELMLQGFQPYRSKESAWARARIGNAIATFHYRAIGITTPNHLRSMGIDPLSHKVYVVKLGYLHPQLEDISGRHILLLSDGASQLDMKRLNWSRVPRPIHPVDPEIVWKPEQGFYDA